MDSKQLTALMTKRDDLITFLNANLEKQIQESQQGLLKKFLAGFGDLLQTDETGKVLNNAFNRNLLLSVDKVFADYGKQHNVLILAALMQGVNQLMNFNADYYGKFEGETKLLPIRKKVVQNMRGWLGINADDTAQENGYLSTLIKSDAVKNQIKDFALKSVMGQAGWQDTKKNLEKLIAGDKDNLGALQKYHRNFSYDLLSQVDRATGKTYADDLKFEFAIYEGGLIETSREFCKKHNGNVYHISEIQKFNPQVAKQPNYNPVTDLGGYGCRHHLNWIPTSLALMLRPDAKKFVDENYKPAPAEEKKAVEVNKPPQEPKKVEPPKVEQSKPLVKPDTPFDEIPIAKLEPFKTSKEYLKGVEAVKKLQSKQVELRDAMNNAAKSANAITAQMKRLKFGDEKRIELQKQWDEFVKQHETAKVERANTIKEIETQGAKDFSEMLNGLSGESTVTYKSTLSNTTVKNKFAKVWEDFKKVSFGYNEGTEIAAKGYRKSRAYYDREENSINLPAGTSKYTIMHELAHSLERNNYVMKQAVEFLERRAGDKPIISLGYKDRREVYQDGGFFSNYVGKVYKGDIYKGRRATEVISMGLEAMYRNPKLFYAQDKEHFELIYNLFFKR